MQSSARGLPPVQEAFVLKTLKSLRDAIPSDRLRDLEQLVASGTQNPAVKAAALKECWGLETSWKEANEKISRVISQKPAETVSQNTLLAEASKALPSPLLLQQMQNISIKRLPASARSSYKGF